MNRGLDLFLTFSKIGLFTFGGGYAMISMIEESCVQRKKWITHDEMMDVTVLAESTPGPIAINAATYIGFRQVGFWGAVVATLGIVLPSFVILYVISRFVDHFLELPFLASALMGIKIAVGLLILDAGISMSQKMQKKAFPKGILMGGFVTMLAIHIFGWNLSSVALMLIAAVISLLVFIGKGGGKK